MTKEDLKTKEEFHALENKERYEYCKLIHKLSFDNNVHDINASDNFIEICAPWLLAITQNAIAFNKMVNNEIIDG